MAKKGRHFRISLATLLIVGFLIVSALILLVFASGLPNFLERIPILGLPLARSWNGFNEIIDNFLGSGIGSTIIPLILAIVALRLAAPRANRYNKKTTWNKAQSGTLGMGYQKPMANMSYTRSELPIADRIMELESQLQQSRTNHESTLRQYQVQMRLLKDKLEQAESKARASEIVNFSAPVTMSASEDRKLFRELKRTFAVKYHPDLAGEKRKEMLTREQIFQEFWAEIERLEKGR